MISNIASFFKKLNHIKILIIVFIGLISVLLLFAYINKNLYKSKAGYPCGRTARGACGGDCPSGKLCSAVRRRGNTYCACLNITPTPTKTPTPTPTKTPTPTPTPSDSCPYKIYGDANCDGNINLSDYNLWLNQYQTGCGNNCSADFNNDGSVNLLDYNIWYYYWEYGGGGSHT